MLNANHVKLVRSVTLLAKHVNIVTLVNTVKVDMKTVRLLILRLALVARQDTPLTKEVLNVKLAERVRMVLAVKVVFPVNTAMAVILLLHHVEIAQQGITTVTKVKVPVCPAYPVNSTMLLVLSNVKSAVKILFPWKNIVQFLAMVALLAGLPMQAVPNAVIVRLVRL